MTGSIFDELVRAQQTSRHHERESLKSAAMVRAVALIHQPEGKKQICGECMSPYPCRTARLVSPS